MSDKSSASPTTRIRIIEAAMRCFAATSYAGVGIRKIAATAKVNPALISYHFGSKAELYREVLERALALKRGQLPRMLGQLATGSDTPQERVTESLHDFLQVFLESVMPAGAATTLEDAAMTILCREMEAPTPEFRTLLVGFAEPIVRGLDRTVGVLRPELDQDERLALVLSLACQLLYMRHALASVALLGTSGASPRNAGVLARRLSEFSLRGLGLAV